MWAEEAIFFWTERTNFITVIPYEFVEKIPSTTLPDEGGTCEEDRGMRYIQEWIE